MTLDELLDEFFVGMGGEHVDCDDDGLYRLEIDARMVSLMESDGILHLIAAVGPVPDGDRERVYRELLAAMFPGDGAEENTLTLKPGEDIVCLYRKEPLEGMDLERFCVLFRSFGESLIAWRDRLAEYGEGTAAQDESFSGNVFGSGFLQV